MFVKIHACLVEVGILFSLKIGSFKSRMSNATNGEWTYTCTTTG